MQLLAVCENHSLPDVRLDCITALPRIGYTHLQEFEAWLPDELLFWKAVSGPWTHDLYLTEPASGRWEELIILRDILRRHPEIADAYGQLKRALTLVFEDDIAGYRHAKGRFLQALLSKARTEKEAST